jgi:hypothetical protein
MRDSRQPATTEAEDIVGIRNLTMANEVELRRHGACCSDKSSP